MGFEIEGDFSVREGLGGDEAQPASTSAARVMKHTTDLLAFPML